MIQSDFLKLTEDLDENLVQLKSQNDKTLVFTEKAVKLCISVLQLMKSAVLKDGFKGQKDEIEFFKNIKPKVLGKLFYYTQVFSYVSKRTIGSKESQRKQLISEQDKLHIFTRDNLEFYQYYRGNCTQMDDRYFVRGLACISICLENLYFLMDDQFSTSHDNIIATILCNDMLVIYFQTELETLDSKNLKNEIKQNEDEHFNSKLYWTGDKIWAIEMIYAIHSTGAVNNGAVDIMLAVKFMERMFHIDLGDPYHTFIEITSRKKERTKFIDLLKSSLIKRLEEYDQLKLKNKK